MTSELIKSTNEHLLGNSLFVDFIHSLVNTLWLRSEASRAPSRIRGGDAALGVSLADGRLFKQVLRLVQSLPGIGAKRSKSLLKHFGGIEAVMSATENQLTEVDGVGLPIAEKIRNLVCEAEVSYKTKK